MWPFGKKGDKSTVVTTTHTLTNPARAIRSEVVDTIDHAMAAVGGGAEVMHAIDGGRIASFTDGGPPVWSVAIVPVPGPKPYTLLLTYGFSQAVCPDALYAGKTYEFSIAVPANCEHHPWAVAALRQLARYQLTSGAELMVGDVMPCQAPITHFPFPPHLRGQLPTTSVDSLVVTSDPVLGTIATSAGPIEVRRIVGVTAARLRVLGPISASDRSAAELTHNPLGWTDISM